jgi:CheY-like chemotaxis protein
MILDNKRIFYVEDDVKNRIIVQTMLEHAGAVVGFARWGGDNVIAKLCNFQPDIILLDLSMPFGVSGYDVFP